MRIDILIFGENIQYLTLKYNLIYRLLKYIHWIKKVLLCCKISDMYFYHKYVLNFANTLPVSTGWLYTFLLHYSINVVIYIDFFNIK